MRLIPAIRIFVPAAIMIMALSLCLTITAQVRPGPMPPPVNAPPTIVMTPDPHPDPPPVPVPEIIKRFTQNEDAMFQAHNNYNYQRTVRVQEFDDKGKATGELVITTQFAHAADGRAFEKGDKHPESTLKSLELDYEHLDTLQKIPLLPFLTSQIAKYDFVYAGTQKLDELDTYIFQVHPKQVDRQHAYFDGVIWVDSQDFVIVKTLGKWKTELGDVATSEFPFKTFDTYRENVDGKIWFPNYLRSDEIISTKSGRISVRLTVKWEDYKPSAPASATAGPGLQN
ncbi:MAG TPA: hypothetical protein VLV89_12475 [Candidatus Acidoferrum sp.]|nr:hypothetical protein [Candidatus Acidoferrum sp.]